MKDAITMRQSVMWFTMHQLGSAFLILPSTLTVMAKQDAWLSIPCTLLIFTFLSFVYIAIAKQMKGKSFEQHWEAVFGKYLGKVLLIFFIVLYPFLIFVMVLRDLGDFITNSLIPETPIGAVFALMLAVVVYVLRSGIRTVGRSAEVWFYVVLLLFALGYLSLIPTMKLNQLLPVMEYGWKPIIHSAIPLTAFPYIESFLFLFLFSPKGEAGKWRKAIVGSSFISGGLFFIMTIFSISVLSEGVIENLVYPGYFIVRTINLGDFYERFEIVVSVLWIVTIFFRMSLLLYVSMKGLGAGFALREPRILLVPLSLIAFIMAMIVWPNTSSLIEYLQVWPYYAAQFGVIVPLLLWFAGLIRQRFGKHGKI